ncbi:hypothetical protein [Ilumatobacter nonamiensis]|uniref:hypothetical protein n=1 Tax=Ilumatobacter nonamiensis TaxID=467093 RepID=UPI0003452121|nr:hypothetical protein [Ilumatobacter nonamiensis]
MTTHTPRRLGHRTPVVAAIVAIVLLLGGGTAHADPAGPTDYRSEILSIEPATPSIAIDVIGGDSFVRLRAESGTEVMVLGYFGEPYLWFLPDGDVRENQNSPTTYQNEERYGADAPDFASADAEPDWETVASAGTYAWHDHRAHWMQPIRPAGQEPGDQILEQVIPIEVDGDPVSVTVISTWEPEPSMLPAIAGGIVGAIVVGAAAWWSRRNAAWAVALTPIALAATLAGWWQYSSLPSETDPRLVWPLLPALALAACVAAVPLRTRSPFAALAAGLVASSELIVWAFIKRDGLSAAIVPTDAPQWFERFVLVAAFVAGVGGVAIALYRLFLATPGTTAAAAAT